MLVLKPDWVWTEQGLRADTCIAIDAGRIVGVLPTERQSHVDLVLPGQLLLPGFVDVHSHAFQRAFRGHVQWRGEGTDDFWSWRTAMYSVANRLTPAGIFAVSRLAFLELALAGVTHVGEFHYLHHAPDGTPYADPDELARQVIAAALDVGIRITLLRVLYGRHSPGKTLQLDQRRFGDSSPEAALTAVARLSAIDDPRVTVGLAPHSVRVVPEPWLRELTGFRGVVHAHVAEQPAEVAACFAEHGKSPLSVFSDAGLLSERFCAVHLTHPSAGDLDLLRAAQATIGVCPSTELDLGDGFLPLEARDGIFLAIGSDSHAVADPLGEARALEFHARALAGRRNVMSPPQDRHGLAERLLRAATIDGARALGAPARGIGVGAAADLVAIDLNRIPAEGMPPLEAAVFAARPEWVRHSWVAGVPVITDYAHPRQQQIAAAARPWLGA